MTTLQAQSDNNKQYKSYNQSNNSLIDNKLLSETLFQRDDRVKTLIESVIRRKDDDFAANLIRAFHMQIMDNEKLRACSRISMINALYFCAEKALFPTNGKIWLIPFNNEVKPIIGVQGYRELIRRNPKVISITTDIVKEHEYFKVISGTNARIDHQKDYSKDSPLIASYAIAEIKDSSKGIFRVCTLEEINQSRVVNKGSSRPDSTWNKWTNEMSRLVPLRKLAKELMVETEISFESFNESDASQQLSNEKDKQEIIDQDGEVFDPAEYDNYESEFGNIEDSNN